MMMMWSPTQEQIQDTDMYRFQSFVEQVTGLTFEDYPAFHRWSVSHLHDFWGAAAQYLKLNWHAMPQRIFDHPKKGRIRGGEWFAKGQLNYAENLLTGGAPDQEAIVSILEGRERPVRLTYAQLTERVRKLALALKAKGFSAGDRAAGVVSNSEQAVVAMLAVTALGGIWSSCSPDFGVTGILERLSEVDPKVLFFTPRYFYNGKRFELADKISEVHAALPSVELLISLDEIPAAGDSPLPAGAVAISHTGDTAIDAAAPIPFSYHGFDHPLFIMFSSGTTGKPKCIVHSAGGTLLQHKKEHVLHSGIGAGTRFMYYTTCGWMMWNWKVSALASGATLVMYDGSLGLEELGVLWRIVAEERVQVLGTSPKFLAILEKNDVKPSQMAELTALEAILTTGAPLYPENFDYVYRAIKPDVRLSSISGGTDIISCFVLGNPTLPVFKGEIQCLGLGMSVESWDSEGKPVHGTKGELVCTAPFPSMPLKFWQDTVDGARYRSSYFERYSEREVWHHGDFIEINDRGGVIIHGRSDATLNPGGVRIGTGEIYRVVEQHADVVDSIVVGIDNDNDVAIYLFVKPAPTYTGDEEQMAATIKTLIKGELTPRHIPARIMLVDDIPYTKSGKKMELAVKNCLLGNHLVNESSCANPASFAHFQDRLS